MLITSRIAALREEMKNVQIEAYIIPSSDPHKSEYVADHWKSRSWISGFTGSAGSVVVSNDKAGLWTDSRYFIQAEKELEGSTFKLHKVFNQGSPQYIDWLIENLKGGDVVGCDGALFSKKELVHYKNRLAAHGITLEAHHDLIPAIWEDRPPIPADECYELDTFYTGESRSQKLGRIRKYMEEWKADVHLVSTLDDIAWIYNLRGSDVDFNPVVIAYSLIFKDKSILFLDKKKVSADLKKALNADQIEILAYDKIWEKLNQLSNSDSILIDESTISYNLFRSINCEKKINHILPSISMKAVKNNTEINHFRKVMIKDAVALTQFYMWLEDNIHSGLTEYDLGEKIAFFRSQQDGYKMESFSAIVGYKGNGAIVHYRATEEGSASIAPDGVLLIDSGGQYLDGTTDITRTISLGNPSQEEKNTYTRVLKGNIALDQAVFPKGTLGVQLDTLARQFLWTDHLNYLHGTGHGVGFFLNVHEGPQGFHPGIASRSKNSIDEHMITTNEPGYYKEGKFGIRIENCLLTVQAASSASGEFYKFETLTLFPIDTSLIDFDLMTPSEIKWLNDYHAKVYNRIEASLSDVERSWMKDKCKAV